LQLCLVIALLTDKHILLQKVKKKNKKTKLWKGFNKILNWPPASFSSDLGFDLSPNIALMVFDFVVATRVTLNPFT
jgi:hypothetical protein